MHSVSTTQPFAAVIPVSTGVKARVKGIVPVAGEATG